MNTRAQRLPPGARRRFAERHALQTLLRVIPLREQGLTLQQCCDCLNGENWLTFTGRAWTVGRLHQIEKRGRLSTMRRVHRIATHYVPGSRIFAAAALADLEMEQPKHV